MKNQKYLLRFKVGFLTPDDNIKIGKNIFKNKIYDAIFDFFEINPNY